MQEAPSFIHLRVHSELSLCDSVVRIPALIGAAVEMGMPAIALTDENNLFGLVKFYSYALKAGVKPIIGMDVWVEAENASEPPQRLTLLCQNMLGYKHLCEVITHAYTSNQPDDKPVLKREWLSEASMEGLIALSGALEGDIAHAILSHHPEAAEERLNAWKSIFPGRFYIELQRLGREQETVYENTVLDLAAQNGVPVVATNDVRFIKPEEFDMHEARVCIQDADLLDDKNRVKRYQPQQYLRSVESMQALFSDIPSALANTVEIAKRCNVEFSVDGSNIQLPNVDVPEGMTQAEYLVQVSNEGLQARLAHLESLDQMADSREVYQARLNEELGVIEQMGYPGYFLIVADFMRWSKENDVPVGPGRGSGAGSLVAYALKIIDIDPLAYDLIFERFLNPERVSMPDFDIDFCMNKREKVIKYVAQYYGEDHVGQIVTYGTMAARAVVRDVGRVLSYPYGFIDRIAKLIPGTPGTTLKGALEDEQELKAAYRTDDEVRTVVDLALKLEGLTKSVGTHAGGLIIAPKPLTEFLPMYAESEEAVPITQFNHKDSESIGLIKFDFLGLRTLTIIDDTLKCVNKLRTQAGEAPIVLEALPLDDKPTFDLLKAYKTTAIFQLESRGMKDLIRRLQPDCFEDIIALVALYRPGPLKSGMADTYVRRKHGEEEVEYMHPSLEETLDPTYGVVIYQEQVMKIAQVLCGYTLGGADILRRAMGKKIPAEMAKQRSVFVDGAKNNNVDEALAEHIFDAVEEFAGYGFNKSHSAAYALVTYQTAYLKAHYPAAFMAAVLSSDLDNTDKIMTMVEECKLMELDVLPPDINASNLPFEAVGDEAVRYGLAAIKGVGIHVVEDILAHRGDKPYTGLADLCSRVNTHKVNKRALEALIQAGVFDSIDDNRARWWAELEISVKAAQQNEQNAQAGQDDLFGDAGASVADEALNHLDIIPWTNFEKLGREFKALGFYFSGHPMDVFGKEVKQLTGTRLPDVLANQPRSVNKNQRYFKGQSVMIGGWLSLMRKAGGRAFLRLDDGAEHLEVVVFDELWQDVGRNVKANSLIIVQGHIKYDDFSQDFRLAANELWTLNQARSKFSQELILHIDQEVFNADTAADLKALLQSTERGATPVTVRYKNEHGLAELNLPESLNALVSQGLIDALTERYGAQSVHLRYHKNAIAMAA